MSHIIAPEVTIDSTPLLIELCSDEFSLETLDLNLKDLDAAASSIKEACSVSTKAINNAKTNILLAYMADPACRRWLKKEFTERVDCDAQLLSKIARGAGFSFYTNDKLVIEDMDNNGEDTPNDEVTQRTGVPEKIVERIKNKIRKKREEAFIAEQKALEEALAENHDDTPQETEMETLEANLETPQAIETESDAPTDVQIKRTPIAIEPIAENRIDSNEPEVEKAKALPSIDQVEAITTQVKTEVEHSYKKEIDELKSQLTEKDAEIARLTALLDAQA
jgi:hypothetical protein